MGNCTLSKQLRQTPRTTRALSFNLYTTATCPPTFEIAQRVCQRVDHFHVQRIGRFVQQQQVSVFFGHFGKHHFGFLALGQLRHGLHLYGARGAVAAQPLAGVVAGQVGVEPHKPGSGVYDDQMEVEKAGVC